MYVCTWLSLMRSVFTLTISAQKSTFVFLCTCELTLLSLWLSWAVCFITKIMDFLCSYLELTPQQTVIVVTVRKQLYSFISSVPIGQLHQLYIRISCRVQHMTRKPDAMISRDCKYHSGITPGTWQRPQCFDLGSKPPRFWNKWDFMGRNRSVDGSGHGWSYPLQDPMDLLLMS